MAKYLSHNNSRRRSCRGFTLAELLIALMVTSIILAAVASLAFAMGSAGQATDDMGRNQAQLRCATIIISELIKHSKLVCATPGDDLAVWRDDDNQDGQINPSELVYIEATGDRNCLRLLEFPDADVWNIQLSDIGNTATKQNLIASCQERRIELISQCSDVQFSLSTAAPQTKLVSILFKLTENNAAQDCQISAMLRGWAGNLLDSSGTEIVSGDDD